MLVNHFLYYVLSLLVLYVVVFFYFKIFRISYKKYQDMKNRVEQAKQQTLLDVMVIEIKSKFKK